MRKRGLKKKGRTNAQAALEFLINYGWVVLVVLVVIGALAYLGVFDTASLLPDKCGLGQGLSCKDWRVEAMGKSFTASIVNGMGEDIVVKQAVFQHPQTGMVCTYIPAGSWQGDSNAEILPSGKGVEVRASCAGLTTQQMLALADTRKKYAFNISLNWYKATSSPLYTHTLSGDVTAKIEAAAAGGGSGGGAGGGAGPGGGGPQAPMVPGGGLIARWSFDSSAADLSGNGYDGVELGTIRASMNALPLPSGLVGDWPLNGNAQDSSGNSYHGVLNNGVNCSTAVAGRFGSACSFNGETSVISIPSTIVLPGNLTFSSWVNGNATWDTLIALFSENDTAIQIGARPNGVLKATFATPVSLNQSVDGPAINVKDGNWHHVAVTLDRSTGNAAVYVDTVLGGTLTVSGAVPSLFPSNYLGGPYNPWRGRIDAVRLYSQVLAPAEIQDLYQTNLDHYAYLDLDGLSDYTIQSGDVLEYDVYWTGSDQVAFDYTTADGYTLRDSGAVDQNGLPAHPATALQPLALNQWYHRRIPLPVSHAGKTIQFYDIAGERDSGSSLAYLDNIFITDGGTPPTVLKEIWAGRFPANTVHQAGSATGTLTDSPSPDLYVSSPYGSALNAVYNYVDLPSHFNFNGYAGATLVAWVKPVYARTGSMALYNNGNGVQFELYNPGASPPVLRTGVNTGTGLQTVSNPAPSAGQWHIVALAYSAGNNVTAYVDGQPGATYLPLATYQHSGSSDDFAGAGSPSYSFCAPAGSGCWFSGEIDELRVYGRALTQEEILSIV